MKYLSMRTMVTWLFGPIVWAAHFFLLYGVTTVVCSSVDGPRPERVRWLVLVLSAFAIAMLLGFVGRQFLSGREPRSSRAVETTTFLRTTAMILAALAAIGILWSAAGGILLPTCASATE
jgi:hypothetical protein